MNLGVGLWLIILGVSFSIGEGEGEGKSESAFEFEFSSKHLTVGIMKFFFFPFFLLCLGGFFRGRGGAGRLSDDG